MRYGQLDFKELGVMTELSCFTPTDGVEEWHIMFHVEPRGEMFAGQYARLSQAETRFMERTEMQDATAVFRRYFLSDSTNQRPVMKETATCCTCYIQQPPLDGSKVAMWMYVVKGTETMYGVGECGSTLVTHGGYRHLWTAGLVDFSEGSDKQTETLLRKYDRALHEQGTDIARGCVRTWFYVRDVDTHYHGLVQARRSLFDEIGLNEYTHYIASTGIGGAPSDTCALVQLDGYAVAGLKPDQQRYLYAPTHLNRTSDYGVTFERGTLLYYGDRRHALISGTASIDREGKVVYTGDIRKQTQRMWENVEKLLEEAGMDMADVTHLTVYLRDIADYSTVHQMFCQRFPDIPTVFTLAPVCRPAWLIEMECMAIREDRNPSFPDF